MLIDPAGNRKYLTPEERRAFIVAAGSATPELETFCLTLAYTGARISEALAITPRRVDFSARGIVVECLKKRKKGVFRVVPVPDCLLERLEAVHHVRERQTNAVQANERLWDWGRTKAWGEIKQVMTAAGVPPSVRQPKALRHAFGVQGTLAGVSLTIISRWLGHADISTTAIYTQVVGPEERAFAERMWS